MERFVVELSQLRKTWIFDYDGTIVKHNGHKIGEDILLNGVKNFINEINKEDVIVIMTARKEQDRKTIEQFLLNNSIRFDHLILDLPVGERILINDKKPRGLLTSVSINLQRDEGLEKLVIVENKEK